MKKTAITLSAALMLGGLVGCGVGNDTADNNNNNPQSVRYDADDLFGARNVNDTTGTDTGTTGDTTGTDTGTTGDTTGTNDTGTTGDTAGTDDTGTTGDTGDAGTTGETATPEDADATDEGVTPDEEELDITDEDVADIEDFTDVNSEKWYAQDIRIVRELGIVEGYGNNTFKPEGTLTRAEMASIIRKMIENGYLNMDFAANNNR